MATRPRQDSRWAVVGQLRAELSQNAAWTGAPDARSPCQQLLPPDLAAAARALCAADWTGVFVTPPHGGPALGDLPMLEVGGQLRKP